MLRKALIISSVIVLLGESNLVSAQDFNMHFSGFATLGVSHNNSDELQFHRDFSIKGSDGGWSINTDSVIGGQVNIDLTKNLDAVAQAVYQDRTSDDLDDYIEWAFVRYRFGRNWSVRGGRLRSDMYLLSEYKSTSYAYLWVRPPVEFYSPIAAASQLTGVDVQYSTNFKQGFLQAKLSLGTSNAQLVGSRNDFSLEFDNVFIGKLSYSLNNWKVMTSYVNVEIDDFKSPGYQQLTNGLKNIPAVFWPQTDQILTGLDYSGKSIEYMALGYQYEDSTWVIQTEIGSTDSNWDLLLSYFNGYISAGYKFNGVTYYMSVSGLKPKEKTNQVPQPIITPYTPPPLVAGMQALHAGVENSIMSSEIDQKTISVGASITLTNTMSLKFQVDRTFIEDNSKALWKITTPTDSNTAVTLFSATLNMVF